MSIFDFLRPLRAVRADIADLRADLHEQQQRMRAEFQRHLAILHQDVQAGPQAVQDALLKVYHLLMQTNRLGEPEVHEDRIDPHGNVLLPLDPRIQIEVKLINPFQPEEYYARLILPGAYARADLLPPTADGMTRQWSLHINTYQAPPQLVEALALLQEQAYHCLMLCIRRQKDATTYTVQYFPSTGLILRNTPGEFPQDMRLFFDALRGSDMEEYAAAFQPSPDAGDASPVDTEYDAT